MLNEWIEDAFRQWQFGLLGAGLAAVLESESRAARDPRLHQLARKLEDEVISPLHESEWVPGLSESVAKLAPQLAATDDVAGRAIALALAAGARWRAALPAQLARLSEEATPVVRERLGAVFLESLKSAASADPSVDASPRVPAPGEPTVEPLEPSEAARAWVAMARAISAWPAVLGEFDAYDRELVGDGRLRALAEQCASLERQITQRNLAAAPSQTVTPFGRRDYVLFDRTTSTLRVLREGLGSLIQGAVTLREGCMASSRRRDLIARINDLADPEAASRPVRWLLDLLAALERSTSRAGCSVLDELAGRVTAGPTDLSEAPRTLRPRLALLARVVDQLDAWGAGPEAWEAVRRSATELIPASEGAVALLRGYPADGRLVETVTSEDGSGRLLHTGLTIRAIGDTQHTLLRRVVFAVAPDMPVEAGALLELASWLDTTSQPADDLPTLCREQAAALKPYASAGDWWAHSDDVQRSRLWRVLQRTAGWLQRPGHEADPAAVQALSAFEAAGFRMIGADESIADGNYSVRGPWFLDSTPAPAARRDIAGHAFGPALSTPYGRFGPTVWLRLAPAVSGTGALARCLARSGPLLAVLKLSDEAWSGWAMFNAAQLDLASNPGPAEEADRAVTLFLALDHRARETEGLTASTYRSLTGTLHRCLTEELKARIRLQFNHRTNEFEPLTSTTVSGMYVGWIPDASERGTILNVAQLGVRYSRPSGREELPTVVTASAGPRVPEELAPWLSLMKYPDISGARNPLQDWFRTCQESVWKPEGPSVADVPGYRTRFRNALHQADGMEWFHRFVELALQSRDAPRSQRAKAWLDTLTGQDWCQVYPETVTDAEGHLRLRWPSDAPLSPSSPTWAFDPTVPAGEVIGRVERFASEASMARCTVSLGREDQKTPLAAAWRFRQAVQGLGTALSATSDRLWAASFPGKDGGLAPETAEGLAREAFAALLDTATDALAQTGVAKADWVHSRLDQAFATRLDRVLQSLREWCEFYSLVVLPRVWTFLRRMHRDELEPDELVKIPSLRTLDEPCGEVYHVAAFGLTQPGARSPLVPCEVRVSTGRPPEHFREMIKAVRDSRSEAASRLYEKLKEWPEAWMVDRLAPVAEGFFVEFWDHHHARFRSEDSDAASRFVAEFEQLLQKSCGLKAVYLDSILGLKPGTYEPRSRTGTVTGRVVEVLRPGLQSKAGFRVPAVVVVE